MSKRIRTYAQAIHEALDLCLTRDRRVFVIGEGVPDPKGIFGTTKGLSEKFGKDRVMDMPVSENALTGICIGAAIRGLRPILTHQRVDFSLLSFDQIVNNAAKWFYMFGGRQSVPLVIRMIIGRGWGQGSQHSQSLQATYAHIPGLKVVMPAIPGSAKGLLIAAVADPNPVIFIEHRWLHDTKGEVRKGYYEDRIGKVNVLTKGKDVTIVATSYMVVESLHAAEILKKEGIAAEVIDLSTISPLDEKTIVSSITKTRRLLVADTGYAAFGCASEIISLISQKYFTRLDRAPHVVALPAVPTSTSWVTAAKFYPTYMHILSHSLSLLGKKKSQILSVLRHSMPGNDVRSDIPHAFFTGPF